MNPPSDNAAAAALFTLACILVGYTLITAVQWLVNLHAAGMRRLAIHRARQRCVNLSSYREHVRSVRCER